MHNRASAAITVSIIVLVASAISLFANVTVQAGSASGFSGTAASATLVAGTLSPVAASPVLTITGTGGGVLPTSVNLQEGSGDDFSIGVGGLSSVNLHGPEGNIICTTIPPTMVPATLSPAATSTVIPLSGDGIFPATTISPGSTTTSGANFFTGSTGTSGVSTTVNTTTVPTTVTTTIMPTTVESSYTTSTSSTTTTIIYYHSPRAPGLYLPGPGAVNVSLTPELETEAFYDADFGDIHTKTHWQIFRQSDDVCVFDITSTSLLTSLQVPRFVLTSDETYYWRTRFYDSSDAASDWSDSRTFTTDVVVNDGNSDGVPDSQEITTSVDLDRDGQDDALQADMKCMLTVSGAQVGVSYSGSATVSAINAIESVDPAAIPDGPNKPDSMPFDLVNIKLTVNTPGDTAEITVYLSNPAPAGAIWYKYDAINGWQDYSAHAVFSADRTFVTIELKDGGFGDSDGLANGIIVDPSGAGVLSAASEAPSASGGGGGCFIATAAYGSPFQPCVKVLRQFRDRFLATNGPGRWIMAVYHDHSPSIAGVIHENKNARAAARLALFPMVVFGWIALKVGLMPLMVLLLSLSVSAVIRVRSGSCKAGPVDL